VLATVPADTEKRSLIVRSTASASSSRRIESAPRLEIPTTPGLASSASSSASLASCTDWWSSPYSVTVNASSSVPSDPPKRASFTQPGRLGIMS
jgi:hypothetical protein